MASFTIISYAKEYEIYHPNAFINNVGQKIKVGDGEGTIEKVEVVENGKAALITIVV